MRLPLAHIDEGDLQLAVARQHGIVASEPLVFMPVGEDSWNYRLGSHVVSVRRDLHGFAETSYRVAASLAAAGLDFVCAPLPTTEGEVWFKFSGYPTVVTPWRGVDLETCRSDRGDRAVADLLGQLHDRRNLTFADQAPVEDFVPQFAARLVSFLGTDPGDWRHLHPVLERLARARPLLEAIWCALDGLGRELRGKYGRTDMVVTHGDISPANVVGTSYAGLKIIDWGGCRIAPPERDLYHFQRTFGSPRAGRDDLFRYYDWHWYLGELAEYAGTLSAPDWRAADRDIAAERLATLLTWLLHENRRHRS